MKARVFTNERIDITTEIQRAIIDAGFDFEDAQLLKYGGGVEAKVETADASHEIFISEETISKHLHKLLPGRQFGNLHVRISGEQVIADVRHYRRDRTTFKAVLGFVLLPCYIFLCAAYFGGFY